MIEVLDRPKSVITPDYPYPDVIFGGMGAWVTTGSYASKVAMATERLENAGKLGEKRTLGVVSITGMPSILVYKLQKGDPEFLNALEHFPVEEIKNRIKEKYVDNKDVDPSNELTFQFAPKPQNLLSSSAEKRREAAELTIVAAYTAVWLAKQGHNGPIGVNVLEKIQLPKLYELLGAMLAGVDYVLAGAGMPSQIPIVLNQLSKGEIAHYALDVKELDGKMGKFDMSLNPREYIPDNLLKELTRPRFLAIVSSDTFARHLGDREMRNKAEQGYYINGLIAEDHYAGGHNAPPRNSNHFVNCYGEPIYDGKDEITPQVIENILNLEKLNRRLWVAGGRTGMESLLGLKALGATGVQIGSIGAYSKESGFLPEIKEISIRLKYLMESRVYTNPTVSPTDFPFQVEQLLNSLSSPAVYNARERQCLYGYLVNAYRIGGDKLGFRCPANRGNEESNPGKVCLCAALMAAVGCGATRLTRTGLIYKEPYIVTAGKKYDFIPMLVRNIKGELEEYTLEDVIKYEFGIN